MALVARRVLETVIDTPGIIRQIVGAYWDLTRNIAGAVVDVGHYLRTGEDRSLDYEKDDA